MTFDPTKPVQTRNGLPARILCTDAEGVCPIIALVTTSHGNEEPVRRKANGRLHEDSGSYYLDLVNVAPSWWVNVYRDRVVSIYSERRTADLNAEDDRIAVLEIPPEGEPILHKV